MIKKNVKIMSMVPGRQFVHYEEDKTVREIFKYAYSQIRLFSQKGAEYSFWAREYETGKTVFWLHGFANRITSEYVIVLGVDSLLTKTLNRIPLR